MPIEIAKLTGMLAAEMEMAKSWKAMNPKEQKVYLTAHPHSKFRQGGNAPAVNFKSHLEKHGFVHQGKGVYTHKNGRTLTMKKGDDKHAHHMEIRHKNGDITTKKTNSATRIGRVITHAGSKRSNAYVQHEWDRPKDYGKGTVKRRPAPMSMKTRGKKPKMVEQRDAKESRQRGEHPIKVAAPAKKGLVTKVKDAVKKGSKYVADKVRGKKPQHSQKEPPAAKQKRLAAVKNAEKNTSPKSTPIPVKKQVVKPASKAPAKKARVDRTSDWGDEKKGATKPAEKLEGKPSKGAPVGKFMRKTNKGMPAKKKAPAEHHELVKHAHKVIDKLAEKTAPKDKEEKAKPAAKQKKVDRFEDF